MKKQTKGNLREKERERGRKNNKKKLNENKEHC